MRRAFPFSRPLVRVTPVVFALVIGCAEQTLEPDLLTDATNNHPELVRYAVALEVNVVTGKVSEPAPPAQQPGAAGGPNFALVGLNEIRTTATNFTRGTPSGGRVTVTFDVALTSLLNSGNLVTPTFPVPPQGVQGLLLIPFRIQDKAGPGSVLTGPQWNGAPFNFFNDFNCTGTSGGNDCYRYEIFPSPLGPGQTSPAQTVGFDIDSRVQSFTVMMILAADIQNTPLPPPPSGAIAGRVKSPEAGALQGVIVTAAGQPPATTDITGGYQLTGVPVGQTTVTLSNLPAGCTDPGPRDPTVLGGGLATADFSVTCPAPPNTTGSIAGTVTSPSLGNLYGVIVVVNPANKGAATDAAGVYAIPGVTQGQVTVSISNLPAGCTNPGTQQATVAAGASIAVNFSVSCGGVPATGSLTGTLNAPAGPLSNVTVTLQPGNLTTTSDNAGVFSFANLQPGTVLLTFAGLPTGCASLGTQGAEIVAGRGAVLNLQVNCGGSSGVGAIRGTVSSPTFGPLNAIGIRAVGTGGTVTGTSGTAGDFLIQGLAAGQVEVTLDAATLRRGCTAPPLQAITLAPGVFATVNFTVLCPTGSISGMLVDRDGAPVAAAVVFATGGNGTGTATTASDGSYGLSGLLVGDYALRFEKPVACDPLDAGPVTVTDGQTTPLNVSMSCPPFASGTVTTTQGPLPREFEIGITPRGGDRFQVAPASDGTYRVQLTSGGYTFALVNLPAGCSANTHSVETTRQQEQLRLDFLIDCLVPGSIAGRVVDRGGQPVTAAQVILSSVGPDIGVATDADGRYEIPALPGTYQVTVQKAESCVTQSGIELTVVSREVTTGNFTIDCPPVATGTLTIRDGLTLPADLQVVFTPQSGTPVTGTVAADGTYRVTLEAGVTYFGSVTGTFASPATLCATNQLLFINPAQQQQAVVVPPTEIVCRWPVIGTVVDLMGDPVAGAVLRLGIRSSLPVGPPWFFVFVQSGTGGDGAYSMSSPAGSFDLFAEKSGCGEVGGRFGIVAGQANTANFTLNCPAIASGTITMTQGALPRDLEVVFTPGQSGPTLVAPVATDGTYRLTLDFDEYIVTLQGLPANCSIVSQSSQSANAMGQQRSIIVDFTIRCEELQLVGALSGIVRDLDGQPVAGAQVFIATAQALTAPDGSYTLPQLTPGAYLVTADKPGSCSWRGPAVQVSVAAGPTTALDLTLDCPATVSGTVTIVQGTSPAGLTILFNSTTSGSSSQPLAADGTYRTALGPANYTVEITGNGCTSAQQSLSVTRQQQVFVLNFTVDCPLGTLAIRFSSPQRPPTDFAFLNVDIGGSLYQTDAQGEIVVGWTAGPVTIEGPFDLPPECVSPDPTTVNVVAGTTTPVDIVIDCPGFGVVNGFVRDLQGAPIVGAWVYLDDGRGTTHAMQTNTNGFYLNGALLAVTYTVQVEKPGSCPITAANDVTPIEGQVVSTDFTLRCPGIINGSVTSSSTGPLAGVQVIIFETGPAGTQWLATTDADGRFTSGPLPDGQYGVGIPAQDVPAGCTQPATQTFLVQQQTVFQANLALTCQ